MENGDKLLLDYDSNPPSRLVWGFFACGIPAITFAIALAGFMIAYSTGMDEKTIERPVTWVVLVGCALGVGLGILGVLRDRRKRIYSYIGIVLSLALGYVFL